MITKTEAKKIKKFLEEFSWLMESYSKIDLTKASKLIDESLGETVAVRKLVGEYESPNPNKQFLIGVLPSLLNDTSIFPKNNDIANFAITVLRLNIPQYHKKSKYEIIGHIVCETSNLDEKGLGKLVNALSYIVKDDQKKRKIAERRSHNKFSWNEIIQELTKEQLNVPRTEKRL